MSRSGRRFSDASIGSLVFLLSLSFPAEVPAHCDTMAGPVVKDAQRALDAGDVTPVLKWIHQAGEAEVREAFTLASAVRGRDDLARELADRYFFETVVRLHRSGEGAPYDGLKPPDSVPPIVAAADRAHVSGSVETLARDLAARVAEGVESRYQEALRRRAHADQSPEAGRSFVSAYVEYVHFIEQVDIAVGGAARPHGPGEPQGRHGH